MATLLFTTEPFLTGKPLEAWLNSMGISDWSINGAGLVDVNGDVNLHNSLGKLTRLPVRFGTVDGYFLCDNNRLVSLEGAPKKVCGGFTCSDNQLISLEGAPKKVSGDFWCSSNQLVSLEGTPKVGGSFDCDRNQLVRLEGAPEKVGGDFLCRYNQLVSLEGAPKKIGGDFYCSYNQLASLKGAPEQLGGDFSCSYNQLVSLEGLPAKVGGDLWCVHNLLVDFKGLERVSIVGNLVVTNPTISGQDNVFVSLEGLPKELYSKVIGLDIPVVLELERKRAVSLLGNKVAELSSEVELG